MYPVGLSISDYHLSEEEFYKLKDNGIDAVEISVCDCRIDDVPLENLKNYSRASGVRLWSYHLPFYPFETVDISSADKEKRKFSVERDIEIIKKAACVGIDKFVIHPSIEPISDNNRIEKLDCCMDSLDKLAESAWTEGADICVEDLPRTCLGNTGAEMKTLLSANKKLKACFDTNHLLQENNVDFISHIASRLATVHISDYDFIDERHWLPGEGKTDWQALTAKLREVNYNGVWLYEVDLIAPDTIERERELTYRDFYDNAVAIFSGRKPPFCGKVKI